MEHAVELPPGPVCPAPGSGPTDSLADLLLATLPGGMLLLSATSTVLHLNPQAAAWWGVAAADAQGQPLTQVSPGRLPEPLYNTLCRVAAGELQPASEYYLPAAGRWLTMTTQLLSAGTMKHWQDITPQHQRGQSYQALADNSPGGLSHWSSQLQLLYANPAFAAQAGRPPARQPGADSPETNSVPRSWRTGKLELLRELTARIWTRLERARAEAALAASEEQFRLLVTATSDVVYRMGADWTQIKQLVGQDFLADTQDLGSTWVTAYIPADDQAPVQAAIAEAIRHKRLFELEHRVQRADGTLGWVYSRAIPVLDARGELTGWLGTARDVSARREAAQQLQESASLLERRVTERTQELQESRDLLHAIAEAQSAYVNAFEAIRDESGHLVDLKFIFVNSITTRVDGGRPLVGRRYLEAFPEAESSGLLDTFRRAIETGVAEDREAFYDDGQLTGWFRNNATRLGDGVLAIGEDITARKQAEQERLRTLRLLEQAEQVASMGSWDYEPATGRLTWSAGMYRLFGLTAAAPVGPDCYRWAAIAEDQLIAERLIRCLTAGTEAFEETLRLQIGEQVKTVRVRGVVPAWELGQPGRLLGVDLDISDVQRLEAENLALRLDQQQALLAILQAQETERSRLAESPHNGLGQLLYAIKLQISQLDQPALPALDGVRAHADRLLADAIQQTRTISHELMPTRLLERGLAAALRDICRDLTTLQLHFACHVWLHEPVLLPSPLQTALYRLAQELAHHVAKHAQATQAALEFELLPGWAVLRAEDNGRGFDLAGTPHAARPGAAPAARNR